MVDGDISEDAKAWGLVTRGGTSHKPLISNPSLHYSNLMYNARSDTLYEKPTFSKLVRQKRTCLVAVDGFFEWKASALPGKGRKQPYFFYRKKEKDDDDDDDYLLIAGLWTKVETGRPEQPYLETFTMLTTDACPSLRWIHHRMPVCLWDESLALEWLENPSRDLLDRMVADASGGGAFGWHAVRREMNSIAAVAEPVSIKSFFRPKTDEKEKGGIKRGASSSAASNKRVKTESKQGIKAFFAPKK